MHIAQPRFSHITLWVVWAYLALIILAEVVTSLVDPQTGLFLHVLILLGLMLHAGLGRGSNVHRLALGLMVAPLIRLLSLSLPLPRFPQLVWYPVVVVPLLMAVWLIVRHLRLSRAELGLQTSNLAQQLMLTGVGLTLGVIEYAILKPTVLVPSFSPHWLWLAALILMVFTGFAEEFVFRGLLQALALPVLGRWALIYISGLFAALHIGYRSLADLVFVFGVGLLFAYIVYWSGSVLGVTLAHGSTNLTLFLVMPYLMQDGARTARAPFIWAVLGSSILTTIAVSTLMWRARCTGRLTISRSTVGISTAESSGWQMQPTVAASTPSKSNRGLASPYPDAELDVERHPWTRLVGSAVAIPLTLHLGGIIGIVLIRYVTPNPWVMGSAKLLVELSLAVLVCMSAGALIVQVVRTYGGLLAVALQKSANPRIRWSILLGLAAALVIVPIVGIMLIRYVTPNLWVMGSAKLLVELSLAVLVCMSAGALVHQILFNYFGRIFSKRRGKG